MKKSKIVTTFLLAVSVRAELTYFCSRNGAAEETLNEQEYKDCGTSILVTDCACTATETLCYTPSFLNAAVYEFAL